MHPGNNVIRMKTVMTVPSHPLRSGPVALAPAYVGPSPPHNHHSKRAPRAAPRTALPLAGRSSPPQSNPPRLPHGSQTPRPTCSRGPVRPRQTRGDQAPGHLPPLGGAVWCERRSHTTPRRGRSPTRRRPPSSTLLYTFCLTHLSPAGRKTDSDFTLEVLLQGAPHHVTRSS